jgi:hypothetical protein
MKIQVEAYYPASARIWLEMPEGKTWADVEKWTCSGNTRDTLSVEFKDGTKWEADLSEGDPDCDWNDPVAADIREVAMNEQYGEEEANWDEVLAEYNQRRRTVCAAVVIHNDDGTKCDLVIAPTHAKLDAKLEETGLNRAKGIHYFKVEADDTAKQAE